MTPLSSLDAAWLHMEEPCNLMMICALFEFAGQVSREGMESLLRERLLRYERFRSRVDDPQVGQPHWVEVEPDMRHHLICEEIEPGRVMSRVGELLSMPLDRSRPLWQFHLLQAPDRSFVVPRLHHAMGDGVALMRLLLTLADAGPAEGVAPGARRPRLPLLTQVGGGLVRLLRILLSPSDPPSPLKGRLTARKLAAASRPFSLEDLKRKARLRRLTLNDLIMSALNEALRDYLQERGGKVDGMTLRAVVPVDLRRDTDRELGNHFGLVFLPLPVGLRSRTARETTVKRAMDGLKTGAESLAVFALLRVIGWIPAGLEHALVRLFGSKATLVATNLPGPREACLLAGVPVESMVYWVPTSGRLGLGVSFLSYAGRLQMGVGSDASLMPDPQRLVDLFTEHLG